MQHTNTSSTSGGSTTSLFYRDLGARWLTTRSKKGIRRSNKNRLTLSKTPIFGWWRPAWNLSFEARVGILADETRDETADGREASAAALWQRPARPPPLSGGLLHQTYDTTSSTTRPITRDTTETDPGTPGRARSRGNGAIALQPTDPHCPP